jgi:hypothetical protein
LAIKNPGFFPLVETILLALGITTHADMITLQRRSNALKPKKERKTPYHLFS